MWFHVQSVVNAANLYVPQRKKNYYKFWWDEEMKLLKEKSIKSNKLWRDAGKPRKGPIFDSRQKCRSLYRKRLRDHSNDNITIYTNALPESLLQKNGPTFWKCWRSKFENRNSSVQVRIDDIQFRNVHITHQEKK